MGSNFIQDSIHGVDLVFGGKVIEDDLPDRVVVERAAVKIRDEIRHRDVEEARRREREEVRGDARDGIEEHEREPGAEQARGLGQRVVHQRTLAAVAGVEEDREVAHFVRNLVRQYGDGSTDCDGDRSEHSGADDRAVHEVVRRVTDQHERAARSMHFTLVRVAVPPQRELLEDEERQDADEERREDPARAQSGQRLRQQLNQRDAEQRADRVAHQPRYQPAAHPDGKNEEARRDRQSAEAAEQAETERDGEQGHRAILFQLAT